MKYRYGTSGFRFKIPLILEATPNIAKTVCLLSAKKNHYMGIMITASHNDHTYNGVKIVDISGELLLPSDEQFCVSQVNSQLSLLKEDRDSKIVIGHDTRPSSITIKDLLIETLQSVDSSGLIEDIGLCTTPQLHYHVMKINSGLELDYYTYYFEGVSHFSNLSSQIYVDCANGVGTVPMFKILDWKYLSNIRLINTHTNIPNLLNYQAGSDYICSEKKFPSSIEKYSKDELYASFDGDADRVVFYFSDQGKFCLLDGDRIISLIVYYLSTILPMTEFYIGVVHTAYSNGHFINYLKKYQVTTECVATGVKHLHAAALKYDIGIYFESNGHGTVLINNDFSYLFPKIQSLKEMCNQLIGDAISDFFTVLTILDQLQMSPFEWYNLYQEKPSMISKVEIPSQSNIVFETTPDQSKLIKPAKLQTQIDHLCKKYPECFAFVRPSGTESCLRYYIECQDKELIPEIETKLLFHIQCCFS